MVSLTDEVETWVRLISHDRIRGLTVEEVNGRVVIRGQAASHHTKQLAVQGALEVLPGDRLRTEITVG
jgi:hypothetical protein